MTTNHNVMESAYFRDILDQPRAVRDTLAALANSTGLNNFAKKLTPDSYERIILTGMGGSFHILNPLYLKLVELGFPVVMAETSELLYFMPRLLDQRTLLIVVSQSGRSAEIIRLVSRDGYQTTVVAVTNDASSPLAEKSDLMALIQAGPEASVSCKTTTATLAALAWIGDCIATKDPRSTAGLLEPAAQAVEQYLARRSVYVESLIKELTGIRHLFVTGRGSSLAATGIGGMIMKEAAHFHSEGLGSAAFRHGPFEMLGEGCYVIVFAGDDAVEPLHKKLVEDVRDTGAKAALIGTNAEIEAFRLPAVSKEIRPILEMIPLHMVSLALAAIAGREAGKFERIGKVTTSE
jgi:glucosamine--fructose-6-phosphate aminotransferase (isomerizing)